MKTYIGNWVQATLLIKQQGWGGVFKKAAGVLRIVLREIIICLFDCLTKYMLVPNLVVGIDC
jgi:hypothetical protein